MDNRKKDAPSAVTAALGANGNGPEAEVPIALYHSPTRPRKRLRAKARAPDGQPFTVTGQPARAVLALLKAGAAGVTAMEVSSWAFRLSHYVMVLRHQHGLEIVTQWEAHEGGRHGRYVLRSTVIILEIIPD